MFIIGSSVGTRAVVHLEGAFRLDGTIVSQNLGKRGIMYGFRADGYDDVGFVLAEEVCTVTLDGTLIPLGPPSSLSQSEGENEEYNPKKKKGCIVQ